MTPDEIERAIRHAEQWVRYWWNPATASIRRQRRNVVVVLRRAKGEAVVAIHTDDRHRIFKGLSRHGARLMRRCDGQKVVKVLGSAGYGTWREREVA